MGSKKNWEDFIDRQEASKNQARPRNATHQDVNTLMMKVEAQAKQIKRQKAQIGKKQTPSKATAKKVTDSKKRKYPKRTVHKVKPADKKAKRKSTSKRKPRQLEKPSGTAAVGILTEQVNA